MSSNFFQQQPVTLKPKELIPDGTDMVSLTNSIVASQKENEEQRKKDLAKLAQEEYDLSVKCARAEIADNKAKAAKAQEDAKKNQWHADVAKRNVERDNQKHVARQREIKSKLGALAAEIADASILVEELDDKKCVQAQLLTAAAKQLAHLLQMCVVIQEEGQ